MIFRLSPVLAWLVVYASATPVAQAGCAHPAATHRASASLRLLEIADSAPAAWTPPGKPCNGPRCRSQAPAADAPAHAAVALPSRPDGLATAFAFPLPRATSRLSWAEPRLEPLHAASTIERPPRDP